MKSYNIRLLYTILAVCMLSLFSCNEKKWLTEKPIGLLTAENSFTQPSDFDVAINHLYGEVRDEIYNSTYNWTAEFNTGTDIGLRNGSQIPNSQFNDYANLTSTMGEVSYLWNACYKIIFDANVVIGRINNPQIRFTSETTRNQLKAQALFFRALAYRFLVDIYGGVPLVLKETEMPKRNYKRASKQAVLEQIIQDLTYATDSLPDVTSIPDVGRLCKAAAYNLLCEIYITDGQYDNAIKAASWVINDPNFHLMTRRFGNFTNLPGDVYSDLFRFGNQSRLSGNMEAIWVCESEPDVQGGGNTPQNERWIGPGYYSILGTDGIRLFSGPTIKNGGRGITWTGITKYADSIIWEKSGWNTDMRNSQYNILRDRICTNPASPFFGDSVLKNHLVPEQYIQNSTWGPSFLKNVPYDDYPSQYILDQSTGLLSGSAGKIDPENYIIRLAETYLLRAEAYIDKGDLVDAAADINVVRTRAHATPVSPGQANIDYLLDERARELLWEKPRRLELMRMGKLVERVQDYNFLAGPTIKSFNSLWPIPFSEIENNTGATLEQNPGYTD